MKYDFTCALVDLDGNNIVRPDAKEGEWQMWEAIVGALMTPSAQGANYDENFRRFRIATDIKAKPSEAELDTCDIGVVKNCAAAVFGPVIVGPIGVKLESAKG